MDRAKSRLIIRGFNQQKSIDYEHTFSPVVKLATVRVLLTLATVCKWHIHQLDINNAFFHSFIDEEIYILPPQFYT